MLPRCSGRYKGVDVWGTSGITNLSLTIPSHMVDPLKSGNTIARFGYADDIGILGSGRTVSESAATRQSEVDELTN